MSNSGGRTAGGSSVPIGDPTGVTNDIAYTDPASGNPVKVMTFPADTAVIAWGIEGDAFPRVVFRVNPDNEGAINMGDGTADPVDGALLEASQTALYLGVSSVGELTVTGGVTGASGQARPGAVLQVGSDGGAFGIGMSGTDGRPLFLSAGVGDPNGVVNGNLGDIYIRQDGGALTTIYRCTTGGDAAGAVWTGIL